MARYFNTTGPCMPRLHYMLPPADRLIGASLNRYIRDELYWVLHAPRQTGKTTFLQSWMREIDAGDEGIACYVSLERCQGVPETEKAMPAIVETIRKQAESFAIPVPECPNVSPNSMLSATLINWASFLSRWRWWGCAICAIIWCAARMACRSTPAARSTSSMIRPHSATSPAATSPR